MAIPMSKERRIKRLLDQQRKHGNNPKKVANLQGRIDTLRNTK